MKLTEGLKSLEKALEQELKEFFVILGESEAPEFWPHRAEAQAPDRSQAPKAEETRH